MSFRLENIMFRHLVIFLLLVPVAIAGAAQDVPNDNKPVPRSLDELETRIREILDEHNVPAASVALVNRDEVLWVAGVGLADRASDRAATADTLFRVGSITKSFTSLAVLRFVEDGDVRLEDRLRDLTPDVAFENPWAESDPIRLAHLLEHTTGFDDIHLAEYANNQDDPPLTLSEGLAFHPHSRVSRWRPGRYMSYCNSGPGMAAAVLEKLSGRPFEEIVTDRVLRPLGMTTATLLEPDGDQLATGYEGDGETPGDYWHITTRPSGALNASAREMAGLLRMFLNRGAVDGVQVWQATSIDRMERPATTAAARAGLAAGYGLSNSVTQNDGFVWHGHGGGMNTFVADYAYNTEHGLGFFVSINVSNGQALRQIRDALRGYLTRDLEPSPEPAADVSAADLAAVEGYYLDFTPRQEMGRFLNDLFSIAVVRQRNGELTIGSAFGEGTPLIALGGGRFRSENDRRASRIFVPDGLAPDGFAPEGEDGALLLGGRNYRRVSPASVWLRWGLTAFCIVMMLTSILFALIWVPRWAIHKLRGAEPPFSRASLARRTQPLGAILILVLSFISLAVGASDAIARLGAPTPMSIGFFVGSLAFALLALVSAVQWWRTRGEENVHRGVRVHSLLVNVALLLTVAGLVSWGLLGLRTWA